MEQTSAMGSVIIFGPSNGSAEGGKVGVGEKGLGAGGHSLILMYVCMYVVCMYVCMYVCVCACVRACMYVCMYVCVNVCRCV